MSHAMHISSITKVIFQNYSKNRKNYPFSLVTVKDEIFEKIQKYSSPNGTRFSHYKYHISK